MKFLCMSESSKSISACTIQFHPLSGSASAYAVLKRTRSTPEVLQLNAAAAADMVCMSGALVEVVCMGRMTVLVCKVCRLADRSARVCGVMIVVLGHADMTGV